MGRKPLSSYPPEVAARMRADYSARQREAWKRRDENGFGARANGAKRPEVQEAIADAVKQRWEEGRYDDRVNGMAGRTDANSTGWQWGKRQYREILFAHAPYECMYCGAPGDDADGNPLNVHHVDERHDNYLLSNLMALCVPCHLWQYHYEGGSGKTPFVTIAKRFAFEYAHILPWHPGKCAQLHGHSGHLEVSVRGRLNPLGVVMDFSELSAAVKMAIVEPLDHRMLNDFLPNPTSEEFLVWAWRRLEIAGLKGLERIGFSETDSSSVAIGKADMVEAYGWARDAGEWVLVRKPNGVTRA